MISIHSILSFIRVFECHVLRRLDCRNFPTNNEGASSMQTKRRQIRRFPGKLY
jgi:hypothetical protein